eukprot:CAMPEP_0202489832 /NCGR_PEP_ID=MMETSP1361-20130828/7435_1 /ASSEMBLY_ACC=CAM_ASM_000849 /TAXON_ID=210615 /ORGANISM="Staurosira complex sp., Strain CCMP2646" /LENGTH=693 /DNA_ID=CAMNT_0049119631 /DNA_START=59 /DNA_END=2140 /DNA_ORIENTATION=+
MENTSSRRAFSAVLVVVSFFGLFCSCHAVPLRGSFQTREKSTQLRMLMKDETLAPTREPTRFPTNTPSVSPSWAPSVQPVIQTVQPVALQLPTVAPSAAPSFAGSGMTEPPIASPPPTVSPTSISTTAAPVGTMVPLADFSIAFRTTTDDVSMANIRLATESYLLETMSRDFTTRLTNIELTALQTRRRLQEFSQTIQYSGNAVFDGAAPSFSRVMESQTGALQDTSSLQMAYNEAGVNIVVQQVAVQGQATGANSTNVALIAGVSVAAAVVLALVAFCLYKWCCNKRDKHVVHLNDDTGPSSPPRADFVKYTPDDFEPSSPKSLPLEEIESTTDVEQDQSVEVDMDEYSLSAASVDSSVKKDPQARQESLLKKLALYQKTEKKPPPPPPPRERIPMPTSLFVPQVIPRDGSELSLTVSDSPSPNAVGRQVSLLDQSGHTDSSGDEMEEDLLPPVPISTGKSSTWELDTSDHHQLLVPSESPLKSQWSLSPHQQQHGREHDIETRLVPTTTHDFPSTTWAGLSTALVPKTYSDGPSDEMNARLEQDLTNFNLPVIVSPEQSGYIDTTPVRKTTSPRSPDTTPPRQQMPAYRLSRARSAERRSRRPPRSSTSAGPITPERKRGPRSLSSRRRSASGSRRGRGNDDDSASYDGSYASSGYEVIEDLNSLSDFLRERREAKRAQRSMQQETSRQGR